MKKRGLCIQAHRFRGGKFTTWYWLWWVFSWLYPIMMDSITRGTHARLRRGIIITLFFIYSHEKDLESHGIYWLLSKDTNLLLTPLPQSFLSKVANVYTGNVCTLTVTRKKLWRLLYSVFQDIFYLLKFDLSHCKWTDWPIWKHCKHLQETWMVFA